LPICQLIFKVNNLQTVNVKSLAQHQALQLEVLYTVNGN